VPRKTVIELSKLLGETDDPITIDILANQVRFSFGNIELTSKVIDGKFPDYNRVIPTTQQDHHAGSSAAAAHAAARGDPVERALPWRAHRLASGCAEDRLYQQRTGRSRRRNRGRLRRRCAVDIGFNINYLLDALATLSSNEITIALQDSSASALFTVPGRTDFKYVVMPMRI
jgi:DNA polymerase-3 subunit beta